MKNKEIKLYKQECSQPHSPRWAKNYTFLIFILFFLKSFLIFVLILAFQVGMLPTWEGNSSATADKICHKII